MLKRLFSTSTWKTSASPWASSSCTKILGANPERLPTRNSCQRQDHQGHRVWCVHRTGSRHRRLVSRLGVLNQHDNPREHLTVGEEVEMMIIDVDSEERRIRLSIKAVAKAEQGIDYRAYLAETAKPAAARPPRAAWGPWATLSVHSWPTCKARKKTPTTVQTTRSFGKPAFKGFGSSG